MVPRPPYLSPVIGGESLTLFPSRWRLALLPVPAMVALLFGLWLAYFNDACGLFVIGWFVIVISLPLLLAGLLNFFPKACRLHLNSEGLAMVFLYVTVPLRWTDVRQFRTFYRPRVGGPTYVVADLYADAFPPIRSREINQRTFGYDVLIFTHYGLRPEQLVETLNAWRLRYGREARTAPNRL